MSDAAASLLRAILDDPDDLASRRVYADALIASGDPRGELITVQCDLDGATPAEPRWRELVVRERQLLAKHGRAWTAPYRGFVFHPVLTRGFVERAFVNTKKFVPACGELLGREPVTSLGMRAVTVANAVALGARPELARLRRLRVTESSLGAKGLAALCAGPRPHLRELDLYQAGVDDAGLAALAPLYGQLERLNLAGTRVSYVVLEELLADPRLARLAKLHLSWLVPGTDGAGFLASHLALPALTHLELSSSHYTSSELRQLAGNATFAGLRGLRLEHNDLEGAAAVDALAPLTRLEVLDLSTNPIGLAGVAALARHGAPLRALRLYQCGVRDEHLEALAEAPFPLRRLDLGYGAPRARGLDAIGRTDWPLEKLELWACKIGDAGAASLASAKFTRTLRELVIGYNDLSDAGAAALAAGTWPRLERLVFRGDPIGEAGARALAASTTMPALRYLKLEGMTTPRRALAPLAKRGVVIDA